MNSFHDIFDDYQFGSTTSDKDRLSPQIPPVSLSDTVPLTTEQLQKKDRLDLLLFNPSKNSIQRRRSICCGHLYDSNHTFLSKPLNPNDSSFASTSSSHHLSLTSGILKDSLSLDDSNRGRTTVSSIHQETDFPNLVKLSAKHMLNIRALTKDTSSWVNQLQMVASRVVNTRQCEPKNTRMSVDEVTSLAKYLYNERRDLDCPDSPKTDSSSERDWLLSAPTFNGYSAIPNHGQQQLSIGFLKSVFVKWEEQQKLHKHIQFEGSSLYYFSSQNLLRFYLWKIIGSR